MTDEKFKESLRNLIEEYMNSHVFYISYKDFLNKNAHKDGYALKERIICECVDHVGELIDDVHQSLWDT